LNKTTLLAFLRKIENTVNMDSGQLVYILSRLILGGVASFLGIMLWSRTRDIAWMLIVMGIISAYGETIYTIVNLFGIDGGNLISIGTIPLLSILLPCFPLLFFVAGLAVMVVRKYRCR
jgi:hypothetical protein